MCSKVLCSQTKADFIVSKKLYTYSDGLPGREVTCAVQDKNGYMWFGTRNGLCRFDGNTFQVFTQKANGLYVNKIRQLFSDNQNNIIICYEPSIKDTLKHIDVIDINTLKVQSFDQHYTDSPFKEQDINQIIYSENTESLRFYLKPFFHLDLRFSVNAKIWELSKNGSFTRLLLKPVKTIKFDFAGKKEVAITETYNPSENILDKSILIFNDGTMAYSGTHWIWANYIDRLGYVSVHQDPLFKLHYYLINKTGKVTALGNDTTNYRGIHFSRNTNYFQAQTDSIIFTSEKSNKLYLHNLSSNSIQVIDSTDDELVKKARISTVFLDNLNNRWLCTTEGVIKVSFKKQKFTSHFRFLENQMAKNHSSRGILAFDDMLFASMYDYVGIKKNNVLDCLSIHANFSLLKTNNTIWLGSFDLRAFDLLKKKTEYKNQFGTAEIWSLFQMNKNTLLLGGTKNIYVYDIANNKAIPITNKLGHGPELVYRFFYNTKKQLLAVANNGVFVINDQAEIVDYYSNNSLTKKNKLPFTNINDLYEDKEGKYWFATANDGLYMWNTKNNTFEQFGIDNGFLSEVLYRIEEDKFGKLWISTDFGLAKFDKVTHRAKIYTEKDGIAHNEFNRSSSFKDEKGHLYFGGIDGITSFNPSDFESNEEERDYPFQLKKVSKYNPSTNLMEDETERYKIEKKIELTENRKSLSLSFILLDLEERDHLYAYQIEGLEKEWNYIREGVLNLSALPYGNYTLRIKAQCLNGLWNKTEIAIPLLVLKPFYKTWWFIVVCMLLVVLSIAFVFRYRISRLQKSNQKLEEKVEQRTAELKESLAEQVALLQEVHHRVKNNLQFIAAMLKMQINSIKNIENKSVLLETSRRINSMSLVHEMLYSKDKLESVSVSEYLKELISKLGVIIHSEHYAVKFDIELEDVNFDINNSVAIGMITSEIISNSIKHAFTNSENPQVKVRLKHILSQQLIEYTIEDNGKGFSEQKNENGLGLRLIDIFARQLEAEYETDRNNGLKYTFKIPFLK